MTDGMSPDLAERLHELSIVVPIRRIRPQEVRRNQHHRASFDEGIVMLKPVVEVQPRRANSYRMNGVEKSKSYRCSRGSSSGFLTERHVRSLDAAQPRHNSVANITYHGNPSLSEPPSARSYRTCPINTEQFYQRQQEAPTRLLPKQRQFSVQQDYYQPPQIVTRTPPAHPRSEMIRRSSGMALMAREWKSDEMVERPHMKKSVAVDVPSCSTGLLRQFFVSDNVVAPAESSGRKFTLLTITPKQRRALKASHAALKSSGSWLKLFEQIFRRLESKCPEIRSIFLTTAFVNSLSRERDTPPLVKTEHDHCKCLVVIMEELIYSDDLDTSIAALRLYGEKHAQMRESGFTPQMIEQFGEIAVSVIVAQDIIKYNHEAVKAWRLFLACVTDEMRVGYEKHTKMSERRSSKAQ